MRRSLSLTSIHPLEKHVIKSANVKRSMSANALMTSIDLRPSEIEVLATQFPMDKVVGCMVNYKFPNSVLSTDDIKDFGACIAEPQEVQSDDNVGVLTKCRYNWLQRCMYEEDVNERYGTLYSRRRKK